MRINDIFTATYSPGTLLSPGLCLMKIGKRDMAEKVLKHAKELLAEQEKEMERNDD